LLAKTIGIAHRSVGEKVCTERRRKADDERHWAEVCASWNALYAKQGSFADEHNSHLLPHGYMPG
jgi:hypothetical protein